MTRIRAGNGNADRQQGETPVEQAALDHAAGCVPSIEEAGPYGTGVFKARTKQAEEAGGLSAVTAERDMLRSRLNDVEEARDRALGLASRALGVSSRRREQFGRRSAAMRRAMYAAWIDCRRGDAPAAAGILSDALDGFDGIPWNGSETGAECRDRTGQDDSAAQAVSG